MTGGLAWVYDADGSFVSEQKFHPDFVEVEPFATIDESSQHSLRSLIERHASESRSTLAAAMLADWPARSTAFLRLTPKPQI
jgi:glutamate synthase (NADPH/NADH) large chain